MRFCRAVLKLLGPEGLILSGRILELYMAMGILISKGVTPYPLMGRDGWMKRV